jgi:hypothetical protein
MCPQGDTCTICGRPAVVEIHWPAWVMKLCGIHATEYYHNSLKPVLVFVLGESNANPSIN